MISWYNYYLSGKNSRLTDGHIKAEKLLETILNSNGDTAYACYFDLDYNTLKLEYDFGERDKDGKKIYTYLKQGETPPNRDHKKPKITFTDYDVGPARPALDLVSFDFDHEEDPEQALNDVKKFCDWLSITDLAIFYSGSKGFHVMVPFGYFPIEADETLPNKLKELAKVLKEAYPTLDTSIYNYNRKFRVPFTLHEKTNRYKTWIPVEHIQEISIDEIIARSEHRVVFDFTEDLGHPEKSLDVLIEAFEKVKRKSYEVEKEKAGTKEKPSPFEKYDGKLCVQKLLTSSCDDVGRNNAALVIVNDFYRTGKTRDYAEAEMRKWSDSTKLPWSEISAILNNIYDRNANYNFGCQHEIKALYCSAKCSIWKKLDPDKRPQTVDMPTKDMAQKIKDFENVERLLTKTFKCGYDDVKGEFYGGNIVKQGRDDLFLYDSGKWNFMDASYVDKVKRRFNLMNEGKLDAKRIEQMFKMFLIYVPSVPENIDMYSPNPTCANFKNGTLHLLENTEGKFYLEFKEHNPLDYLAHKIEYDYNINDTHISKELINMLENVFDEDEDKQDKINAIAEMYGASIIPFFPHLFYLYGKAQSGKSSIMLILNELHGKGNNICSVQPKDFNGFNLESMAGKLVNMVTDVNTRRAIDDDIVKQIEDRIPVTIRRKNRTDIKAPLPSVHIFGGNDLLTSYEGYSEAMQRRWTILKFNKVYDGPKSRNFASRVFNSDPQGIVNFAVMGLQRLVDSQGYFTNFNSSKAELESWAEESDTISQFLDQALNGETEIGLVKHENSKIERKVLWDFFAKWQDDSGHRYNLITKSVFYKRIESKGYKVKTIAGVRYFSGLGELASTAAVNVAQNSKEASI